MELSRENVGDIVDRLCEDNIYDDSTLMKSCIMCHVQQNVRIIAKALYLIEIETGW